MIQRREKNYLVRYPAVADSKQSKSKMTPFETVFSCNLHYNLITGVFKLHMFLPTYQRDLIHIQRAQNSVKNIFTFLESI